MWFEILPSAGIIFAAMSLPHFSAYVINKLVVGNTYRRSLYQRNERMQYLRDIRLSPGGNPYDVIGLEGIPDED